MNKSQDIFIAPSTFAKYSNKPLNLITDSNYKLSFNKTGKKLIDEEIIRLAQNATGIIAGTELYSEQILSNLPKLKVISRLGVGMDNIDLEITKKRGIKVYRTKTNPGKAVAELVIGFMISLARNITKNNQLMIDGHWKKEMGFLLSGKTLGIVGLGSIGKNLVKMVRGFNFKILAFDKFNDNDFAEKFEVNYCSLDKLLSKSDFISIHLNLSEETKNLIDEQKVKMIKSNAILINTSRGEVIDEMALYKALSERKIKGAALDVFNKEPYFGPLVNLENVILSPHIGAYAKEVRMKMELESVQNLMKGLLDN